jgi:hypothetical protein
VKVVAQLRIGELACGSLPACNHGEYKNKQTGDDFGSDSHHARLPIKIDQRLAQIRATTMTPN